MSSHFTSLLLILQCFKRSLFCCVLVEEKRKKTKTRATYTSQLVPLLDMSRLFASTRAKEMMHPHIVSLILVSDLMDKKTLFPVGLGVILLWLIVALGMFPITLPGFLRQTIVVLPLLAIVLFGFASLFYLGYKVVNLKDCPEALVELKHDIERIRSDSRYKSLFRPAQRR